MRSGSLIESFFFLKILDTESKQEKCSPLSPMGPNHVGGGFSYRSPVKSSRLGSVDQVEENEVRISDQSFRFFEILGSE